MLEFSKQEEIKNEILRITKLTKIFSLVRFILFVCIVIFVVFLLTLDRFVLDLTLSLCFIAGLVAFCIITSPYYHKLKTYKNLEFIYKKHNNRRNLSYYSFTPDGREFINYEDYKEIDLDLLGPKSLFQYLCVAKSKEGRRKLAVQLTNPKKKDRSFTEALVSLAQNEDTLLLEAAIALIDAEAKDCDEKELLGLVGKKIHFPLYAILACVASYVALILCFVFFLLKNIELSYLLFFIPLNFILAKKCIRTEVFQFPSTKYANLLSAYRRLAKDILEFKTEDKYLLSLKNRIEEQYTSLVRLSKTFELLSYRKNILLSIIGNGVFYMDYWIAFRFNQQAKHFYRIEECLDALSEVELLLSLATIGIDQEIYSIPTEASEFKIVDGYHPLVKNCVPNSLELKEGIVLTGSNMSGKTTFMRMLGINQILANAGGLVCAKEFHTNAYTVVTSLRANDMLQEGISTFYAEVNRMKNIISTSANTKTLVLVDEIFKGTNAKDRIYAAKQIISKLNSFDVLFLITTHDFELCDLNDIQNYHFDEEYVGDEITFDYKLKNGKCQKTNAIYLLKLAGVLDK